MSLSKKNKLSIITAFAFVLVLFAAAQLRGGGAQDRVTVLGWGFILIFGSISFVRGIFAIRRCK